MIDVSKIKPGDTIQISVTVIDTGTDYRGLPYVAYACPLQDPTADSDRGATLTDHIVAHIPRAPEVGDRVKFATNPNSIHGAVIARDDRLAWVRWDGTSERYDGLERLDILERLP